MCIMKQSDQILSRRFLCSLVLLIKRQGSRAFILLFGVFRYEGGCRGFIGDGESSLKGKDFSLFIVPSVLQTDGRAGGRTRLDLRETILTKRFLCCNFFLNVVVFNLGKKKL